MPINNKQLSQEISYKFLDFIFYIKYYWENCYEKDKNSNGSNIISTGRVYPSRKKDE